MWKCANDIFGYCSGGPDWETPPEIREAEGGKISGTFGGTCKLNKNECGKFQQFQQQCPENTWVEPSEIKTKIIPDPNTKADTGKQAQMVEITKEYGRICQNTSILQRKLRRR